MPQNLELKIALSDFTLVKKNLKKIKAEYIGLLNQKDIYYKTGSKLLKLRILDDRQELIQYKRDEKGNRFSDYSILGITDINAGKFFADLFKVEAMVIKKRHLYWYDNTRVHLDEVEKLGFFLELETLVLTSKAEAIKRFNRIKKLLQLDVKNQIRKSYRDLIMKKGKV